MNRATRQRGGLSYRTSPTDHANETHTRPYRGGSAYSPSDLASAPSARHHTGTYPQEARRRPRRADQRRRFSGFIIGNSSSMSSTSSTAAR